MARVTVEGGLIACEYLPRGVRRTVELTPRVRRRIERGYYVLVSHASLEAVDQAIGPPQDEVLVELDEATGGGQADDAADAAGVGGPPAGNASTEEWLTFLRGQGVDVPVNEHGETPGREGLKAIWQQVDGGR